MGTIRIIGAAEDNQHSGTKGGMSGANNNQLTQVGEVSSEALQSNLSQLVSDLNQVLHNIEAEQQQPGYKLKQFNVAVEISAKGGVSLIGKLEAGAKAGVTLVFERS